MAQYDLDDDAQLDKAASYLSRLAAKHAIVEVREVKPTRTSQQNRYLHLILGYLGMEIGEDLQTIKDMYKMVCKAVYYRSHKVFGVEFKTPRSSKDLTVEEMSETIDYFREWSDKQGHPLPAATDKGWLLDIEERMAQEGYKMKGDRSS